VILPESCGDNNMHQVSEPIHINNYTIRIFINKSPSEIHVGGRRYIEPTELITLEAYLKYTKLVFKNGKSETVTTTLGLI
jgi:hypothetical protein